MNKQEMQKNFPHVFKRKMFEHDERLEVMHNGVAIKVQLDTLDWECNRSPFSTLWARRTIQVHVGHDGEKDLYADGPGEAIGVVFIATGKFVPLNEVSTLYYNVPDKTSLLRLYWMIMDEIMPPKVNFITKLVQKVVAFFSKKK